MVTLSSKERIKELWKDEYSDLPLPVLLHVKQRVMLIRSACIADVPSRMPIILPYVNGEPFGGLTIVAKASHAEVWNSGNVKTLKSIFGNNSQGQIVRESAIYSEHSYCRVLRPDEVIDHCYNWVKLNGMSEDQGMESYIESISSILHETLKGTK